ncbi:hypothetical protein AVEN_250263-1 [Araneus ventricosus]|uniref:Uncharacterized protein n=1 Tax=Araneus ventricosus TaxID=182803 RepID=A0A4Y2X6K7_ARAVE|nr:hypothetical protein AVEN_250263-1 [Araneus ventricosus]
MSSIDPCLTSHFSKFFSFPNFEPTRSSLQYCERPVYAAFLMPSDCKIFQLLNQLGRQDNFQHRIASSCPCSQPHTTELLWTWDDFSADRMPPSCPSLHIAIESVG